MEEAPTQRRPSSPTPSNASAHSLVESTPLQHGPSFLYTLASEPAFSGNELTDSIQAPVVEELVASDVPVASMDCDSESNHASNHTLPTQLSNSGLAAELAPINIRLRAIEDHNKSIEDQLTETQGMLQTLTELVQRMAAHQDMKTAPSSTPTVPQQETLSPSAPTLPQLNVSSAVSQSPDGQSSRVASTQIPRQNTTEEFSSITRTMKVIPPPELLVQRKKSRAQITLASAVSVMTKVACAASAKTLRIAPEGLVPTMTRRFSVSSLDFNVKKEGAVHRITRWSCNTFFKPHPEAGVSKMEFQAARTEDLTVHPLTIRHDSPGKMAWEVLVLLLILVDIVLTPLSLSFDYKPNGLRFYNALATAIFAADFIVQAFSSYVNKRGDVISGPSRTIPFYLVSWWALADFLSWFPFEYLLAEDQGRFLGIAKVIRLVKISQLARRFNSSKKAGVFRLLRLFGIVFLVSHCLACYWNWVAGEWRHNEEGYLLKPFSAKYARSWSLVIGSLNASPPMMYTPIEEISVALLMLIGNVLQASVFGSVAVLISSFDEEEVAYNRKLLTTYERCKLLDVPEKLADRIRSYYEHLYRETHSVDPDADAFINELSPALICEVKFHLYRDMVKQIPFFSSTSISSVVIEMLILKLRSVIYMQDDVLIRKGEFGDWMGFIGTKGSVGILDPNSETHKIIRILRKGEYFGEMGLLHNSKRTTTAVALSWVQIHVLSRNDLDEVKTQYAEEAESLEAEIKTYMRSRAQELPTLPIR